MESLKILSRTHTNHTTTLPWHKWVKQKQDHRFVTYFIGIYWYLCYMFSTCKNICTHPRAKMSVTLNQYLRRWSLRIHIYWWNYRMLHRLLDVHVRLGGMYAGWLTGSWTNLASPHTGCNTEWDSDKYCSN